MCIIIDTNTLANVFDESSINHIDFKPVNEWIFNGTGKVVYGGSKYKDELKKKYLGLYVELKRRNKAIYIEDDIVDQEQQWVSQQIQHTNFDDQHLVALLRISGCKLICSLDARAYPYFKHKVFFHPSANRPKIYNQYRCRNLLVRRNIAAICQ